MFHKKVHLLCAGELFCAFIHAGTVLQRLVLAHEVGLANAAFRG